MSWKNFPIPETIVFPLAAGLIIDKYFPRHITAVNIFWIILSGILLLIGFIGIFWSVREAGKVDMVASEGLLTSGPYAISRNPMYVSWDLLYLGVFFLNRSLWLLLLFIGAILSTHFLVVIKEEKLLKQEFGNEFVAFCQKVRRYL